MTEKLAGTISADDEQLLDELIEEDEHVREKWESLLQTPPPAGNTPWLEVIDFEEKRHPVRQLVIRLAVAAAIFTAVVFTGWKWWQSSRQQPALAAVPSLISHEDIQLQLANGKTILLSNASENINVEGKQLTNKNKTLSYNNESALPDGINTLKVPVGQDYQIKLPDGTLVFLNAVTKMEFPFAFKGNTREITINGEAYLKIAKDPSRPFIVHLPHSRAEVLGTSFNVNSYDSGVVKVSLVEGSVRVNAGHKTILVKPGLQAIYSANTQALHLKPFDADIELSWRKGIHYFTATSLPEICTVLSRWYGVRVKMDNQLISTEKFTGSIERTTAITIFLESLKETTKANYYFSRDSVLHFQ
ncbi:FecR family protein [Chitinophaga nivalis]|uniref:FecR domain-containing protein n=1 Tax=Chitinophaga nivalis TaxID=2991709 RepID=A0ABT3ILU5_9BACT|nr:FecR family protein [Chitinophaga nivalis]MCW3465354.1 FecR domain-containing protein [Chitinophaga nivalis]MCW3484954.1 FecR domain-containing protein [Chitinophaga nivalis]